MNVKYFISKNLKEKNITLIFSSGTELTFVKENIDSDFKYDDTFIELIEKDTNYNHLINLDSVIAVRVIDQLVAYQCSQHKSHEEISTYLPHVHCLSLLW